MPAKKVEVLAPLGVHERHAAPADELNLRAAEGAHDIGGLERLFWVASDMVDPFHEGGGRANGRSG